MCDTAETTFNSQSTHSVRPINVDFGTSHCGWALVSAAEHIRYITRYNAGACMSLWRSIDFFSPTWRGLQLHVRFRTNSIDTRGRLVTRSASRLGHYTPLTENLILFFVSHYSNTFDFNSHAVFIFFHSPAFSAESNLISWNSTSFFISYQITSVKITYPWNNWFQNNVRQNLVF